MIFDETRCELGEGPLWHPARGQLFWFDILGRKLLTKGKSWSFDTYVSAAGWIDRDTLLIATASALIRFDLETGKETKVVALEADNSVTRSNDGRADPMGGFWIGTMGIMAEPQAGAIYRFYKGTLRKLFDGITIPNAICFAPDASCAYFTDTPTQQILRVSLDADGWPNSEPTIAIDLTKSGERPDGAVVDQTGNLWNAQWGQGRVAGYTPSGDLIETFAFPAAQTSCPAFGGTDGSQLYCTSAAEGLNGPNDGMTFCAQTRYRGQAEHRVIL